MQALVDAIRSAFHSHESEILAGDFAKFFVGYFERFSVHEEARGKTVVTLHYRKDKLAEIPAHARNVDIFILKSGQALGPHYHKHASAQIHFLSGAGRALIAESWMPYTSDTQTAFPAGVVHDVAANTDAPTTVFISLQDQPILKPDGTLDYFDVATESV